MSMTDPISDMLVRIKNSLDRRHQRVSMPSSKLKIEIARLLKERGFIKNYEFVEADSKQTLDIELLYFGGEPAIQGLKRLSTPGRRQFSNHDQLSKLSRGNDLLVITTSRGVMSTDTARAQKVGGELICRVW